MTACPVCGWPQFPWPGRRAVACAHGHGLQVRGWLAVGLLALFVACSAAPVAKTEVRYRYLRRPPNVVPRQEPMRFAAGSHRGWEGQAELRTLVPVSGLSDSTFCRCGANAFNTRAVDRERELVAGVPVASRERVESFKPDRHGVPLGASPLQGEGDGSRELAAELQGQEHSPDRVLDLAGQHRILPGLLPDLRAPGKESAALFVGHGGSGSPWKEGAEPGTCSPPPAEGSCSGIEAASGFHPECAAGNSITDRSLSEGLLHG